MIKSEDIKELATALGKAQSQITGAIKDTTNPFFKSKYADLSSVMEAIRKPFSDNGLSYTQTTMVTGTDVLSLILDTTIMHTSGQWISGQMPVYMTKIDPQGLGSALTYTRRYALSAIAGITQIDDDGNAASVTDNKNEIPDFPPPKKERTKGGLTPAQLNRLTIIQRKAGMPDENLFNMAKGMGIVSSDEMTKEQYDILCATVEKWNP